MLLRSPETFIPIILSHLAKHVTPQKSVCFSNERIIGIFDNISYLIYLHLCKRTTTCEIRFCTQFVGINIRDGALTFTPSIKISNLSTYTDIYRWGL